MLSTVVLSNENQTCRGLEAPTSTGGEDVTIMVYCVLRGSEWNLILNVEMIPG